MIDEQTPKDIDGTVLPELIEAGDREACASLLDELESADAVHAVSRLDEEERARLLTVLEPSVAAEVVEQMPWPQAVAAIGDINAADAAKIVDELPSDRRADVIGALEAADAAAIVAELDHEHAAEVRLLTGYADDVAGGLMVTEYLRYPISATIGEVVADLGENAERYADYEIQYAYVTDGSGQLVGVLRLRDLLLSPRSRSVRQVMIASPESVADLTPLEELVAFFDDHGFYGVPVVDGANRLCGVVRRSAVEEAVAEDREGIYRRSQGIVGGEELRSMPLLLRSRRRLSWLSVNIVLNVCAASVIAMHQSTLEAVIALAVFLPIISDMSGCSGNQAVAVSMRELTLGVLRPGEIGRALLGELWVGLLNGLMLGLLIGLVALAWKGNPYLGLVVGGALMMNTLVAVLVGGSVPLLLKRLGFDPALAAGPILTTVTDMCGFLLVLTLASAALPHLTA